MISLRRFESTMRRNELARIAIVSAFAIGSLSGCSTYRSVVNYVTADNPLLCPDAAILANTASLPAFDPARGADPSNIIYTVAMTDVATRCDYSKRQFTADANLKISFRASRPPGGEDVHYRVPYYVAITSNGEIQDKQIHWLEFDFSKGVPVATGEAAVDSIVIKVGKTKKPYEYHLIAGFQLTKAQVDYNKTMGRYEP
jgi:hypothetical protein